jgi:hypothetical protein
LNGAQLKRATIDLPFMPKCIVCGKEGHGPERHGLPSEWGEEDQKSFERAAKLYAALSEEEVCFIVTQFDSKNGLTDWRTRLVEKEQRPIKLRRNWLLSVVLGGMILIVGAWLWYDYQGAIEARNKLKYIYDRKSENRALAVGLKWIDDELDALAASAGQ